VFTRTKHGAKSLARKLTAAGVPSVELHGNLSQGARTRNLAAFSNGNAPTMVATDIAARGIHVDDIGLVVHADPPVEHKAYLHRSGRTARAGATGTVVTLMTDAQVRDVRDLTRKAGISPTTTKVRAGHPLLEELAPGTRALVTPPPASAQQPAQQSRGGGRRPRAGSAGGSSRRTPSGRGRQDGATQSGKRPAPRRSRGGSAEVWSSSGGAAAFSSGAGGRRGR
jgi:superfamily II DNA/RNA helicase